MSLALRQCEFFAGISLSDRHHGGDERREFRFSRHGRESELDRLLPAGDTLADGYP